MNKKQVAIAAVYITSLVTILYLVVSVHHGESEIPGSWQRSLAAILGFGGAAISLVIALFSRKR